MKHCSFLLVFALLLFMPLVAFSATKDFIIQSADGNLFVVKGTDGNTGVGISIPSQKFQVAGPIHSTTTGFKFPDNTTQSTAATGLWNDQGSYIYPDNYTSLVITDDGNLGIGTTSPTYGLDVVDDMGIRVQGAGESQVTVHNSSGGGKFAIGTSWSGGFVPDSFYIRDVDAASQRLVIDSSGKVGINTTSPASKLHVWDGDVNFSDGTNGFFYQDSTHRVGVGTTSPSYKFTVETNTTTDGFLLTDGQGTPRTAGMIMGGGSNLAMGAISDHEISFMQNNVPRISMQADDSTIFYAPYTTEAMKIQSDADIEIMNGNLGIGTTSPGAKLDVNGAATLGDTSGDGTVTLRKGWNLGITDSDNTGTFYSYMDSGVGYLRVDDAGEADGKLNVNSGTLYVQGSAGNVGIGTTTPTAKLDVAGDMNVDSGTLVVRSDLDRVGIGTTSPAKKLHIGSSTSGGQGDLFVSGGGATRTGILMSDGTSRSMWLLAGNSLNPIIAWDSGDLTFKESADYSSGPDSTGNVVMTLKKTSGNVGINTTTPQNKLNVVGDINATGTVYAGGKDLSAAIDGSGVANRAAFWTDSDSLSYDGNFTWDNSNKRLGIGTTSPGAPLHIKSGHVALSTGFALMFDDGASTDYINHNTTGMHIYEGSTHTATFNSGNVGIGTTTPDAKLDVAGDLNVDSGTLVVRSDLDRVGIGTTSPSKKLEIYGGGFKATNIAGSSGFASITGTNGRGVFSLGRALSTNEFQIIPDSSANWRIGTTASATSPNLYFYTNGANAMAIDSSGSVGINTTTPQNKLNVVGDINATTNVYGNQLCIGTTCRSSWPTAGATWDALDTVIPWADANVADDITLTNITQVTNRSYTDLQNLPHVPTDATIDANAHGVVLSLVPWQDANVADDITLTNITQITNRSYTDLQSLPHIPTDATIDANAREVVESAVPWADANVADDITLTNITQVTNRDIDDLSWTSDFNSVYLNATGITWSALDTVIPWADANVSDDIAINNGVLYAPQSGNVGIGTTSPGSKLQVEGDINAAGNDLLYVSDIKHSGSLSFYTTDNVSVMKQRLMIYGGTTLNSMSMPNISSVQGPDSGDWTFKTATSSGDILFQTRQANGATLSTRMKIEGETDTPDIDITNARLDVDGNVDLGATSGTLFVDSPGQKVGIGTTSPVTKLNVMGGNIALEANYNIGSGKNYGNPASAADGILQLYDTSTGITSLTNTGAYSMNFGVNNSIDMTIISGGNVGINTTTPQNKLNVVGDINATTNVYGNQLCIGTTCRSSWPSAGASWDALDTVIPWADANVADDITLTNITQITNRSYADLQSLPHIPSDSTIDANARQVVESAVPWADANVADDITLTNITQVTNRAFSDISGRNFSLLTLDDNSVLDARYILLSDSNDAGRLDYQVIGNPPWTTGGVSWTALDTVIPWADANVANDITIATTKNASFDANVNFDSGVLFVDSSNDKVGIGTTSPTQKLHIRSANSAHVVLDVTGTTDDWGLNVDSSNKRFYINEPGTGERFTILQGGSVGIGTTSPDVELHVKGATPEIRFEDDTAGDGVDFRMNSSGAFIIEQNKDAASQHIYIRPTMTGQSNTKHLVLNDQGGNVGIGDTTPGELLHVYGSGGGDETRIRIESGGADGNAVELELRANTSNALWEIGTNKSSTGGAVDSLYFYRASGSPGTKMVITNGGEVGIGDTTPSYRLELQGHAPSNPPIVGLGGTGTNTGSTLYVYRNRGSDYTDSTVANIINDSASDDQVLLRLQQDASADIVNIFDGATEVFTILDGGSVGIGDSSPTGKLQVAGDEVRIGDAGTVNFATGDGDLYVEDALEVDGSATVAGNTVWHAGNDGDGSGLDADKVDGYHASSFAKGFACTERTASSGESCNTECTGSSEICVSAFNNTTANPISCDDGGGGTKNCSCFELTY